MYATLISTETFGQHLNDPEWAVVDCRFYLADPGRGRREYLLAHIPGAIYAHLDEDLSGPVRRGVTGRHPLPGVDQAAGTFGGLGIGPGVQVVAYDDAGGALAAARLWWLLRWLGHPAVAVLDGGWTAWQAEGRPVKTGEEKRQRREFVPRPRPELVVEAAEVEMRRRDPAFRLFDVRLPERYRGDKEPIDPVAGHIPGALNLPYVENLGPDGKFRSKDALRSMYRAALGELPAERAIFYCGSGATAAHNLLAMLHAGLGEARLYAGSWSEWITDPGRQVDR
jgi:thiosulfate/3-mercaptopyruvate sulfurtransferase